MKKRTLVSIFLISVMLMSATLLSGCGMVKVDAEKDLKQVVATVNGKDILKSAFLNYYYSQLQTAMYYAQFGGASYDESTEEGKANIEKLKDDCLEGLIRNEFIRQEAEKGGYLKLTDEQKKEVEKELNDNIAVYVDEVVAKIKDANKGKTDEEIRKLATDQYWSEMGYTTADALENAYIEKGIKNYKESLSKGVTVTQTEIVNKYNTLKEDQKKNFDASYSSFEQTYNNGGAIAYNLKGYITVQSLLISITDEEKKELDELAAKDATDPQIKTKRAAALKKIEKKAKEILGKAQVKDADFSKLIEEYGEDPGMADAETREKGYLVGEQTTAYVSEYKKAALELKKVGDMTGLVESNYGYFIIKKLSDIPSGEVELSVVQEKIEEEILAEKQTEKQNADIDAALKNATIKRYKKRLKIIDYSK